MLPTGGYSRPLTPVHGGEPQSLSAYQLPVEVMGAESGNREW